jgi:hypothetical protein
VRAGLDCQDAAAWIAIKDTVCVAVSDGAGSAAFSGVGSLLACRAAIEFLETKLRTDSEGLGSDAVKAAVSAARNAVLEEARTDGKAAREFACTLVVVLANARTLVCAHIGDGGAVVEYDTEELHVLSFPRKGRYANETDFLTEDGALSTLLVTEQTPKSAVTGVAVFSDGCERQCLDFQARTAVPRFFSPLFQHLRESAESTRFDAELRDFLGADRFAKASDDDKTLVLGVYLGTKLDNSQPTD